MLVILYEDLQKKTPARLIDPLPRWQGFAIRDVRKI